MLLPKSIEFNRPAKYKAVKHLGAGACGETVLVHDESMECYFVVKKYSPYFNEVESPKDFEQLLNRFKHEAKILFQLNHENIVRVYNYYDYKEHRTSYILMEYIEGENIFEFSRQNPLLIDSIFEKLIDGFSHLEERNILHRDIRPGNILVELNGNPKIIDFGFGKKVKDLEQEANKSITLNWWCETPPEFQNSIYDFQTELYFVGKLFEQIVEEIDISAFKYKSLIKKMCERNRERRFSGFTEVKKAIATGKFEELSFTYNEIKTYRDFANALCHIISSIDESSKYERDNNRIISELEAIYKKSMLELNVLSAQKIGSTFIKGPFRYWTNRNFETAKLKEFIVMIKSLHADKQNIVLENLLARLDSVTRSRPKIDMDDDIPF